MTALAGVCAAGLPGLAAAKPFNVGPYVLGMKNAEAAKIGLSDCALNKIRNLMECRGKLDLPYAPSSVELNFDASTKRLNRITVRYKDWASDDERLPV